MCFSAGASFGAGIILAAAGVATLKKAKKPAHLLLASIPLIFCVQQVTEGFLWLALSRQDLNFLQPFTTYAFLFFAQVVWPLCVPLAILLVEKNEKRKWILKILTGIGAIISMYLAFCLWSYPVEAKISGYHIYYEQNYPAALSGYGGMFYIIATIAPSFFSTIKRMWILGSAILLSYIITAVFYTGYIVSVWCFFAAVISLTVYTVMTEINKSGKPGSLHGKLNLKPA